ncbi:hypothetical protein, partial [Cytobacillus oceanisediminis]|uniref:hypothetical protein n=1 Tax=Cytobacillus oceanisediminis TaxID=665099 RepID=UPI0039EE8716
FHLLRVLITFESPTKNLFNFIIQKKLVDVVRKADFVYKLKCRDTRHFFVLVTISRNECLKCLKAAVAGQINS